MPTHTVPTSDIMAIKVARLSMDETVDLILKRILSGEKTLHSVVNALKLIEMERNAELRIYLNECDIVSADGQYVVFLSRIIGRPLPERVAGCDLMQQLVEAASKNKLKIFLLGAAPEVVRTVAEKYRVQYGAEIIAGYRDGYFTPEEEPELLHQIALSGADLLFVALGSPKQELFIKTNAGELFKTVRFVTGVGGTFDVVAGKVARAPLFFRKHGLEWLYRTIREPQRIWKKKLYLLPLFIYYAVCYRFQSKHGA